MVEKEVRKRDLQHWKMKYFLPQRVVKTFLSHAVGNLSREDSRHIETLAFLIGRKSGNDLTVTDIIFPQQKGNSDRVDDIGIKHWNFFNQKKERNNEAKQYLMENSPGYRKEQ